MQFPCSNDSFSSKPCSMRCFCSPISSCSFLVQITFLSMDTFCPVQSRYLIWYQTSLYMLPCLNHKKKWWICWMSYEHPQKLSLTPQPSFQYRIKTSTSASSLSSCQLSANWHHTHSMCNQTFICLVILLLFSITKLTLICLLRVHSSTTIHK